MSKEFCFEITIGIPGVFEQVVPGSFEVRRARKVTFFKHAIDAPLFFKILLDKITALNEQAF